MFVFSGCTSNSKLTLGIGGTAVVGGVLPIDEIEQTYYLGVYDPQGQIPPSIFRVRVNGQSSFLNNTKFASGWAHSSLVDSFESSPTLRRFTDENRIGLE